MRTLTKEDLVKYGMALFGNQFQTDLAKALDVNDRTMRRWLSGESPVPEKVGNDLGVLVKVKFELLGELTKEFHGRYIKKQNVLVFTKNKKTYRIYLSKKGNKIWFSIYDYVSEQRVYRDHIVFYSFEYIDGVYVFDRARREVNDSLEDSDVTYNDIKNYLQENINFSDIEENTEEQED